MSNLNNLFGKVFYVVDGPRFKPSKELQRIITKGIADNQKALKELEKYISSVRSQREKIGR